MKILKKNSLIVLLLLYNLSDAQTSIPIPFLQPFEYFDYYNQPSYVGLETVPQNYEGYECPNKDDVNDAYGYSWLLDETQQHTGKSLKLTVHPEDHPCSAKPPRDRSEINFNLPTFNETSAFIRWDMLIPDNEEFVDEEVTIFSKGEYEMHKIFQLKANNYNPEVNNAPYDFPAVTPILGMSYVHREDSVDKSRDLYILIQSPNIDTTDTTSKREGTHRMTIRNAIKKGEWNEIMFKFNFSMYDSVGYFQVWINNNPVIIDESQTNHYWNTYYSDVIIQNNDILIQPSKIFCANVGSDDNTQPIPTGIAMANNIKFGHYRRNHLLTHSMYIDNVKVTNHFPPAEIPTKLTTEYCNTHIQIDNQNIVCDPVPGALNYKFRFEHDGNYYWINSPVNNVSLLEHSFLQPATTYNVQVRAQGSTFDFNYGDICSITTASHTKLRNMDCNDLNSPNYNSLISSLKVHNATNYKFRFQDVITGVYFYGNRSNTFINPSSITGINLNRIYNIQVRAQGNGFDFDYGDVCQIKFIGNFEPIKSTIHSKTLGEKNYVKPVIFPNPFTNHIFLNHLANLEKVRIFDLNGSLILQYSKNEKINTEKLSSGLYFIEIQLENGVIYNYKIVKK